MRSQMVDEIKRLNQIRKKIGWSQQKLATELGVGISTLNRWERGKCNPGNLALDRIRRFMAKRKGG